MIPEFAMGDIAEVNVDRTISEQQKTAFKQLLESGFLLHVSGRDHSASSTQGE